jgi:hypothetical protein
MRLTLLGPALLILASASVSATSGCDISLESIESSQRIFEARVAIVDEHGHVEQVGFPWLSRHNGNWRPVDASSSWTITGFGWRDSVDTGRLDEPGMSRRLSMVREGRALRVSVAEPGGGLPRSALLNCRDGLWTGFSERAHAWVFMRLSQLLRPQSRAIRRIDYERP